MILTDEFCRNDLTTNNSLDSKIDLLGAPTIAVARAARVSLTTFVHVGREPGSRRARSYAVDMAAGITEDDIEGGENELLAARRTGAGFAGNDVIGAHYRTGWALRLRFYCVLEILGKMKPVARIGAEWRRFLFGRLFLGVALSLRGTGDLVVVRSSACIGQNFVRV